MTLPQVFLLCCLACSEFNTILHDIEHISTECSDQKDLEDICPFCHLGWIIQTYEDAGIGVDFHDDVPTTYYVVSLALLLLSLRSKENRHN